jgi:LytR cell envelope-related transcriptional attenuator/LysM domain
MNGIDAFRNLRPDDAPFDSETDLRIRDALGLEDSSQRNELEQLTGRDLFPASGRTGGEPRRRFAVLGAAAAAIAGVIGFTIVRGAGPNSVDTRPADERPPATDAGVAGDSLVPRPDPSTSPASPGVAAALNDLDDPQLIALGRTALSAAEWNLPLLDGEISAAEPFEPFATTVFSDVGDGRVSFVVEPLPPSNSCRPTGWEQELSGSNQPGTRTPNGMLYLDEVFEPAVRVATVVSEEAVVTVRSELVPFADLPTLDGFADTAQAIVADLPNIFNGGERPRFYEVRCGDVLTQIANRFETNVDELVTLNALPDQNTIYSGMILEIPPDPTPSASGQGAVPNPNNDDPDRSPEPELALSVQGLVLVANANAVSGSAGWLSDRLEDAGFGTVTPARSSSRRLTDTVIYARSDAQCLGEQLAEVLGIDTIQTMPEVVPVDDPNADDEPAVVIALGDDIAAQLDTTFALADTLLDCAE